MNFGITKAAGRLYTETLRVVAPQRAVVREHLHRMEKDSDYREAYLMFMRVNGYRAAKNSDGAPFTGGGRSADAEILYDLPPMRNRSRELNRDDSLGSGLTWTFASNVIGTGMQPQAVTKDPAKNANMEAIWTERKDSLFPSDGLCHGAAQRLHYTQWFQDGEALVKAVFSLNEPVWFETIEADRLATPPKETSNPNIRDGVERDDSGRVVAYWIMKGHPGDSIAASMSNDNFIRVDASLIRHIKRTDRPGQTRGVPRFHAIQQDIKDLDLLMLAAIRRTQIAACFAAFIKSTQLTPSMMPTTAQKYGYVLDQKIVPGMIYKLLPNESIETLTPNFPSPELAPFIFILARRIGAALGVCPQTVLRDFGDANYSSARTNILSDRITFGVDQNDFKEMDLNWEWAMVMTDAQLRGDPRMSGITPDEIKAVEWVENGWQWVDPEKEAAAAEIELRIGTTTKRDLCAAKGKDWEKVLTQQLLEEQFEINKRKELGLPPKQQEKQPEPAVIGKAVRDLQDAISERMRTNGNSH